MTMLLVTFGHSILSLAGRDRSGKDQCFLVHCDAQGRLTRIVLRVHLGLLFDEELELAASYTSGQAPTRSIVPQPAPTLTIAFLLAFEGRMDTTSTP